MKHPVDEHVGKRIRQCRWMVGMTQQQLAEAVGIKFQQIQKYETGANRVSASRLWDISRALGAPIDYFFDGIETDGTRQAGDVAEILADKEALDLMRALRAVPQAQRRRLFDLARALGGNAAA